MLVMGPPNVRSYEKFNYLLRPSKQVERKLFIETLHRLRVAGYPIYEYTYLGLGSVFYADFILFHKYLYIDKMICAERDKIRKRMEFNKPFGFVKLVMKPVSDLVAALERDVRYLVWLDYDTPLAPETLQDVDGFIQVLAPGSILLITVEAEPRIEIEGFADLSAEKRDRRVLEFYREEFQPLLLKPIVGSDISKKDLPVLISRILRSQISNSLISRTKMDFHQLFNFLYADGRQMLTLGGIVDVPSAATRLKKGGVFDLEYIRRKEFSETISVPPLTTREKGWIDKNLLSAAGFPGKDLGLDASLLKNYAKFYKYYPTYYETLV
jgi:hypothetical protein